MEFIEVVGWVATGFTMLSFVVNKMLFLRALNLVACIIWVVYGIFTDMNPVIATNTAIAGIHLFWFFRNYIASPKKENTNEHIESNR
jgi:hypothetical protein